MILSVKDGFLLWRLSNFEVLQIVMSKKLIWLSDSGSAVNFMFGWSLLKSSYMFLINYQNIDLVKLCSNLVFAKKMYEVGIFLGFGGRILL